MSKYTCSVQRAACSAILLAGLAAWPAGLMGQSAAELAERVRRLEQEVTLAKVEDDSLRAEENRRAMAKLITLHAGGLELMTTPELRSTVEDAGRRAWTVLSLTYEDSVAVILRDFPISILSKPPEDSTRGRVWYPSGTRLVFATEDDPVGWLPTQLLAAVSQELWLRQDQGLRDWLVSPPPVTIDLSSAFAAAYLDLATSVSPIAQRCLMKATDCREALGLARPADRAADWFSPEARREYVVHRSDIFQVGDTRQAFDRCVTGSDRDCLELLEDFPDLFPSVLRPPTLTTFLRVALENGGPGSYPILLASSGQVMEARIRQASGIATGQLLEDWHRRVISARPPPTTIRQDQAVAAFGWTVVLLIFALRSSRWR